MCTNKMTKLTSSWRIYFDRAVLQKISSWKYGFDHIQQPFTMETVHIHYDLETKQHSSHQFEALYLKSFALNKAAVKASFTVITVETQMKFLFQFCFHSFGALEKAIYR